MKRRRLLIALLLCALLSSAPAAAITADANKEKLRVLFIGNSYTYFNNLPEMFAGLAASARPPQQVVTRMVTRGGATLKLHWEMGNALKAIGEGGWDYVVLQDQSTLPITDPATTHRYARLFDAEIKKVGAKTIFFLTWARQHQPENQAKLNDTYLSIARELGARVAPVGIAWAEGFKEDANLALHTEDQSHPNPTGSYLAACVFYAILFDKSPESLSGRVLGRASSDDGSVSSDTTELVNLGEQEAKRLQRLAWQTVRRVKTK